jgi:hypothetical protein
MFILNVFNKSYLFSTKRKAQQEGASFLMKHTVSHYISMSEPLTAFTDAYNQEDYNKCLDVWNDYINDSNKYYGSSFHKMTISEVGVDKSL